jgi:hypothetical protein
VGTRLDTGPLAKLTLVGGRRVGLLAMAGPIGVPDPGGSAQPGEGNVEVKRRADGTRELMTPADAVVRLCS